MEELDFKNVLNIPEIKKEYDDISSIDDDYFMIIRECFVIVNALDKYLSTELIKGIIMLKIDNISRILGNLIVYQDNKDEYRKLCFTLNKEFLDILKLIINIKKSKKSNESLEDLKNYYLSMRHLIYYYKILTYNYNVKVNEIINLEKGIMTIIPLQGNEEECKVIKEKIKEYYEVKNGSKKFKAK